jgi:hypothetical protein
MRGVLVMGLLGATLASSAQAQVKVHGTARLGVEYGGDKVVQFEYADGSKPEVTAGGGLLLSAGLVVEAPKLFDAQLNAGWKYRTIPAATNQDASWSRFPVEALLFYRTPAGLRIGGGATVHLANSLKSSGEVLNQSLDFKTKPGFLLQAEYVRRNISFDVRYTVMKYEVASGGSGTVNANSLGAGFSFLFGQ